MSRDKEELRALLKKVRQVEIRSRKKAENILSGEYKTVFKGMGIEFEEVREYQRGDDVRSIDWNVTARMGHLFVKKYREERELTVYILVDISASQFVGSSGLSKKDVAEELAAVLGFSASRNKDKVGLVLFSEGIDKYIPAKKGSSHFVRIIREVVAANPAGRKTSIQTALEFINKLLQRKAIIFLLSDFFDTGYMQTLQMTAGKHDLVPILLRDPLEQELPPAGLLTVENSETGEVSYLDTSSSRFRDAWRSFSDTRDADIIRTFRKMKVDSFVVRAGTDYIIPLMQFFKMRAARY